VHAQVLRFWGYFKESVTESNIENHRVRRVVLYYYLADDSLQVRACEGAVRLPCWRLHAAGLWAGVDATTTCIIAASVPVRVRPTRLGLLMYVLTRPRPLRSPCQVAEPKQDNSGIPQGVFVRRHRVLRGGVEPGIVAPADLTVGATVTLYGRTFFLVDADPFTREWYQANLPGVKQGPAQGYPTDMVREARGGQAAPGIQLRGGGGQPHPHSIRPYTGERPWQ
jgi:hypothetical protein